MLSMHLRQLTRKSTRVIIFILILVLLTAFFCVSLNLYANSMHNLKLADEAYTTIAIMELYADVDTYGNLIDDITKAEDYAGFHALIVHGYDLAPVVNAPSVIKYDLRAIYGAFSDRNIALTYKDTKNATPLFEDEVIRFKLTLDGNKVQDPNNDDSYITFNLTTDGFKLPDYSRMGIMSHDIKGSCATLAFDVIETATGVYSSRGLSGCNRVCANIWILGDEAFIKYANELKRINYDVDEKDYAFLEPETEYIGIVTVVFGNIRDEAGNKIGGGKNVSQIIFRRDRLFSRYLYKYSKSIGATQINVAERISDNQPFWLYKYEDLKNDAELMQKYDEIRRAYYINAHSFGVTTTNDLKGVLAFNLGNMYMKEGRAITTEEFASGAKVCMIGSELAALQGWKVGQKISFDFYEYDYFTNATSKNSVLAPRYLFTSPDHFFDSGEYEVVGIYDVRPMTGSSTISEAAISVPWNTIYIPEKSLENAPAEEDRPVTGALLTIWLENGKIEPFIERMNELGITGAKQGDYEARFTFYDQGYSRIQPSLEALSGTAELLLILSSSLLVIAALLLAFFYAQSQKQSIGTMRLLGCSKARAFVAVMLSALIIAVTGALIGAAIGHALTASVGESIMANANQTPEEFLAFSAYLAESTQVEVEFALGADAKVSLLTCLAALGLFIAGTLVFVVRYLGKGPRELLPRAGE